MEGEGRLYEGKIHDVCLLFRGRSKQPPTHKWDSKKQKSAQVQPPSPLKIDCRSSYQRKKKAFEGDVGAEKKENVFWGIRKKGELTALLSVGRTKRKKKTENKRYFQSS